MAVPCKPQTNPLGPCQCQGNPPYSATIAITSITYSGGNGKTANVTTTAAHGLATGQEGLWIAGATPTQYDGSFAITVTGTYTFTYTMASKPGVNASGTMTALPIFRGYGFVWVDGDAFTNEAWVSGQPSASSNPAYVAASSSGWSDASASASYPYVIEFNLGLASPPSPPSDTGNFSVVEAHGSSALTSISGGMALLSAGTGTVTNYTAGVIEYDDPQNVVAGHFTAFPFGGNTSAADHNFAVHVEGSIQIPAAGTYTFDVTSGDGFQLSIGTQTFTGSSSGTTYGSTMIYSSTARAPTRWA